jgi:hypothetical protein
VSAAGSQTGGVISRGSDILTSNGQGVVVQSRGTLTVSNGGRGSDVTVGPQRLHASCWWHGDWSDE